MTITFTDIVSTEAQMRELIGAPSHLSVGKTISTIDEHCRAFIARSTFLLIASSDADGQVDVSPKGDPPGFVQVLDEHTLAIPDRPGNRRADTFTNILQNPKIGLLFFIPGNRETLRVSGTAAIVKDAWLLESMAVKGKVPSLALAIDVNEAFLHCPKCIIRSHLWEPDAWPDLAGTPAYARVLIDHGNLSDSEEEVQAILDRNNVDRLY